MLYFLKQIFILLFNMNDFQQVFKHFIKRNTNYQILFAIYTKKFVIFVVT